MLDERKPTILVATDFTPASRPAFEHGLALAMQAGGRLLLVHATRPLGAPGLELTRPDTTKLENETAEPVPAMGLAGAEWAELARAHGVESDIVVRPGLPAAVIREEADRVDAHTIVLGSQQKSGLAKALLGSVSETVRGKTVRPVVVVEGAPGDTRPPRPGRDGPGHDRPTADEAPARRPL